MTDAWYVVGAVAAGTSHQKVGTPCQDALNYQVLDHPDSQGCLLVAALADGAGSASRSELGSHTAVEIAIQSLSASLDGETLPETEEAWSALLMEAFTAAQIAIYQLAEEEEQPVRSYATTLTCLVVHPQGFALAALGDGVVVRLDPDGSLNRVNQLQRGEYANETYFLTQEFGLEQVQIVVCDQPGAGFALMSDGLARLALSFPAQEPFLPFFQPLFAFAAHQAVHEEDQAQTNASHQLEAFLNSERVSARTDDDKSLLIAVRCPLDEAEEWADRDPEVVGTAVGGDSQSTEDFQGPEDSQ